MIVVRPKSKDNLEKLVSDLKEKNRKLNEYKRVQSFVVWEKEFPRTASLKVKRNLLAEEISKTVDRKEALKELT
jgi:long-chain acyl-CoA synthetase